MMDALYKRVKKLKKAIKRLTLIGLLWALITPSAMAWTYTPRAGCAGTGACYWYGGTGNWSDTTKWFTATGGAGTSGNVPTSADDAITNAASNATAYTLTVDATANCKDLTFGNPASGVVTVTGSSSSLNIYGSMSLASGMTFAPSYYVNFLAASGTKTLTSNNVPVMAFVQFAGSANFQLVDDLTFNGSTRYLTLIAGNTFDPNGHAVVITCPSWNITGAFTFYDLSMNNAGSYLNLGANIVVTHALSLSGASATSRLLVASNTIGTPRTITAAAVSITNADFRDITGAGVAIWDISAGNNGGGTVSGCTGITFTTPATQYFYKASGNANTSDANWYLGSGGTGGAGRVPLIQDTARFDVGSFGAGSMTVTQDMPRIGSVDWTGATNTPTWTTSTVASVFGSITLIAGMTLTASTQAYTFEGRLAALLTSAGKTWAKQLVIQAPGGTLTALDAFVTSSILRLSGGDFTAVGNVTAQAMVRTASTGIAATLTLGAVTWTITGNYEGIIWVVNEPLTLVSTGSTIKFTDATVTAKSFGGGSKTYCNLWLAPGAGTGNYQITGSNTFTGYVRDDGAAAHSVLFTAGTTNTAADWQISGNPGQRITIGSITAATHTLAKSAGDIIDLDYLSISNSIASPANMFYAGRNSTNGGGNTNWQFINFPGGRGLRR